MTCTVNTTCHRLDSGERIRNATSINLPQNKVGIDAQRSRILVNPCQQDYTRRWGYRETRKKTGGEKYTRRRYIYIYIYKGGRVEKILAGFSLPSAVLPCHILLPFSSSLLSSSSSSSTSLHDYRPLSPRQPSYLQPPPPPSLVETRFRRQLL